MSGIHVRFEVSPEDFLAHLTEAVYAVALQHGFKDSFLKVQLDLWDALREVIRKDMLVATQCGSESLGICTASSRAEPWSKGAEKICSDEK